MYRLYGIPTQNTLKVAYVMDALGLDYEFKRMDLAKGEQKTPEFLKINPIGKVPALQHDDFTMFESGAICRYVANENNSELYPKDSKVRAQVDQWLDFFSCHLGRWLSILFFQKVIKVYLNGGEPDAAVCEEAASFAKEQFKIVDTYLGQSTYFAGDSLSIADLAAFAYIEQVEAIGFDIGAFSNVQKWLDKVSVLQSIKATKSKIKP